jgi:excisionase family DNA binding protein
VAPETLRSVSVALVRGDHIGEERADVSLVLEPFPDNLGGGHRDEITAQYLDCPKSRIYALTQRHAIPFRKEGSRLLFKRSLLDVWVAADCPVTKPGRVAS